MKILKALLKGGFWILIIALLLAPVYLIYGISNEEMKQYEPKPVPVFRETAYGTVSMAMRMDVREIITVSGVCVSNSFSYMELDKKNASKTRWEVSSGDEMREGQVIGTYNGKEIKSSLTGIIAEMDTYSESPFIKVKLLEPVELECFVDDKTLSAIKRAGDELTTEDEEKVELTYTALTKDPEGRTKVRLSVDSDYYAYGMEIKELKLLTGRAYLSTLVLDPRCLYQKEAGSKDWYARKVTEDGFFIEEVKVEVGYDNGNVVCVTGVNEGEYFDTGYRAVSGAND